MSQANIKAVITAEDRASATLKGFGGSLDRLSNSVEAGATRVRRALTLATAAAVGFAVKSAADFEQSRIAFDTMLGSAEKGKKIMKDLSDFARKTPFELPEVVQGAKQLLAYGISAENVMKDLKTLGDISAGVGRDKLPFITLAFGQVATKGKLAGQEIRQFTEAGIPLVNELAKSLGKTREEIVDMSENGEISFENVRQALEKMTGEGGKFFQLMDRQSKSFSGVVSNIKDNVGRLARSVVGIDEFGDIKEGSIFARLRDAAIRLLVWLDANQGEITQHIQDFVDKMIVGAEDFTRKFSALVKSEGFAGAITQSLIELISKINWAGFVTAAIVALVAVGPDIILGFANGLYKAATENPLNFFLLFAILGFVPALGGLLAAVLSAIPIIGPIAAWVTTAFTSAASAVTGKVMSSFASVGASAGAAFSAALLAGVGAAVIVAAKMILDQISQVHDAINNLKIAESNARVSNDAVIRRMQVLAAEARARGDTGKANQIANQIRGFTGRASGGPVAGGTPYIVGERGPELFVPDRGGKIIPNGSAGGGSVSLNVNIGMYAGTELEKRRVAESIFRSLKDVASAKNMTLGEMMR